MAYATCLRLQAVQALEQIAELQPGDAEVAKMLARLHHRLGDSASATAVLQVTNAPSASLLQALLSMAGILNQFELSLPSCQRELLPQL